MRALFIPKAYNWGVNPDVPLEPIAQWVMRYRRGIPQNANCAAWWLNYDLLCGTQRVLPCFEFSIDTLPRTYEGRNWKMGRVDRSITKNGQFNDARFNALERALSAHGPTPPVGLRAALWEGMGIEGGL